MRVVALVFLLLGGVVIGLAIFLPTTVFVGDSGGFVHNLGLMQRQAMAFALGLVFFLAGVAVALASKPRGKFVAAILITPFFGFLLSMGALAIPKAVYAYRQHVAAAELAEINAANRQLAEAERAEYLATARSRVEGAHAGLTILSAHVSAGSTWGRALCGQALVADAETRFIVGTDRVLIEQAVHPSDFFMLWRANCLTKQ